MANDWRDYHDGLDRPGYPRADYSPHPIASGAMSSKTLFLVIAIITGLAALLGGFAMVMRSEPLLGVFAVAGLILSWGYTDPPLRLKRRGLGELSVLLVWGPLMGGGTYLAATGTIDGTVLLATLPWGAIATAVLFGKHLDKIEADSSRGVGTFVVRIGERRARAGTLPLRALRGPRRRRSRTEDRTSARSARCRGAYPESAQRKAHPSLGVPQGTQRQHA
ncbi:MAG: prenyltransferase, partial [Candidatus Limnocylindrus sp.]